MSWADLPYCIQGCGYVSVKEYFTGICGYFQISYCRELAALVDDDGVTEAAQSKNEFSDYNYNRIQNVISANTEENADRITKEKLGDNYGHRCHRFPGIHVLKGIP